MSTTRFVTLELDGGERRDLLHVLLGSEALQIGVYQSFTVVQAVGQGEENVNLKYYNSTFLGSNINLEWVHL